MQRRGTTWLPQGGRLRQRVIDLVRAVGGIEEEMKKSVFLAVIIANVAVVCIVLARRASMPYEQMDRATALSSQSAESLPAEKTETPPKKASVTIPLRPDSVRQRPTETGVQEIWQLRVAAFDVVEQCVRRLSGTPDSYCLLGKLQLRCGSQKTAEAIWLELTRKHSDFAEAYMDLGFLALNNADYPTAQMRFEQALDRSGGSLEAIEPLAEVLLKQRNASEAIDVLAKLFDRGEVSPTLLCLRGQAHQLNSDWEAAAGDYERALEIQPNNRQAIQGLVNAYRLSGKREPAKKMATELASLESGEARVSEKRDISGRDIKVAEDLLVFAAQTAAEAYLARNLDSTTQQMLSKPRRLVPLSQELAALSSRLYLQSGEYDKAIEVFRQLADAQPERVVNWLQLGQTCMLSRRMDDAEAALRKAMELSPNNQDAHRMLAEALMYNKRNVHEAVITAGKLLQLAPSAKSHYLLGTAYFHAGQSADAIKQFRHAIELAPANAEYRETLMHVLSQQAR